MASVRRVEIWSDCQCNGGKQITPLAQLLSLTEQRTIQSEHTLSLSIGYDHPAVTTLDTPPGESNLQIDRVLRLVMDDSSWTEHRIATVGREKRGTGRTRTVVARAIAADLGFRGTVARTQGDGHRMVDFEALSLTPRQQIETFVLTALAEAGQPFWRVGTMAVTKPIDIVYAGDSPLSALHKIRIAAGNLELGVRGFANAYFIDIIAQVGRTSFPAVVRARKNLVDLGFTEVSDDQATRVYAFGAPTEEVRPSLGSAEWLVTAVAVAGGTMTLKLADESGGPGPIAFNSQFTSGHYLQGLTTLRPFVLRILSTNAVTQEVTVPVYTFTNNIVNTRVRITANAAKAENLFVDHPASILKYGVRASYLDRSDIPGTNNWTSNPFMRIWPKPNNPPTGWLGQFTKNTDPRFWQHGGVSGLVRFGPNVTGAAAPFARITDGAQGLLSFFVGMLVTRGFVRVALDVYLNTPTVFNGAFRSQVRVPDDLPGFPDPNLAPPVVNTVLGAFVDLGIAAAWDLTKYPAFSAQVIILPDPTTPDAEVYIDTAQVTNSQSQLPLLEGNGGVRLHQAANERLAIYHKPATPITVSLLDLTAVDGSRFPYDALSLGGMVRIIDPDGDVDAMTRIVGWQKDHFNRSDLQLQISDERKDITAVLAGLAQNVRHQTYAR